MKQFLMLAILFLSSTGFAGELPRIGIDGKEHKDIPWTFNEGKTARKHSKKIDKIVKEIESRLTMSVVNQQKNVKSQRLWVQDVYQDGLWYYGYYIAVNGNYEFRYSRREYKGALSNFRSLYSVQYKWELRSSNQKPVKVVYEPAY